MATSEEINKTLGSYLSVSEGSDNGENQEELIISSEEENNNENDNLIVPLSTNIKLEEVVKTKKTKELPNNYIKRKDYDDLISSLQKLNAKYNSDFTKLLELYENKIPKGESKSVLKQSSTKSKLENKFPIEVLRPDFIQKYYARANELKDRKTSLSELKTIVKSNFFDDFGNLKTDLSSLDLVTKLEYDIHCLALKENKQLFLIKEIHIPKLITRLQNLPVLNVELKGKNQERTITIDLEALANSSITRDIENKIEKCGAGVFSNNDLLIFPSALNAISSCLPLNKINNVNVNGAKTANIIKALYELKHPNIYKKVVNKDFIKDLDIGYLEYEGEFYLTDLVEKLKKETVNEIVINGGVIKIKTAIEKLYTDFIEPQ